MTNNHIQTAHRGADHHLRQGDGRFGDSMVRWTSADHQVAADELASTLLRVDDGGGYFYSSGNDMNRDQCAAGPVRVVVARIGKEIVKIETHAGPLTPEAGDGTNLGAVGSGEASKWLLSLATSLEGRPARDALLPAMIADSSVVTPALAAIVEKGRQMKI